VTPGEERLLRHERRRQADGQAAEAARFADYGLSIEDALERIRREPRRRCPCAAHGGR
jgi:hypothetical protein